MSPAASTVPSCCGNERWIVQTTNPAATSAMTTTTVTTLTTAIATLLRSDRRGRGGASGVARVSGIVIEALSGGCPESGPVTGPAPSTDGTVLES
ncbi:hypothetical protein MSA03_10460 [Microbacterium saccharophilum]|nr:hypothetical protein MSA03_10460 [Microbacterium saccharophilum]